MTLRALDRLDEVLAMNPQPDHPLADGAIQRFEFSIVICCRLFQAALALEDGEARTARSALRGAYKAHWIDDEWLWLRMLEDRNRTSHTYRREIAVEILGRLPGYRDAMRAAAEALPGRLTPD